jgi:RNA recognition motif-containing protein
LPFSATEATLRDLFAVHGEVHSVSLATHSTGTLPRGFGYVEMDDDALAAAVSALNGYQWQGRRLMVSEARERIDQD